MQTKNPVHAKLLDSNNATNKSLPPTSKHVVFAEVVAVEPPAAYGQTIDSYVWGVLGATSSFSIRQHVKVFPKKCCACPPCVKQENTYSVYAGLRQDSMAEFLRVDEVSDDWNRCCCAPYHPLKLEVRPYIPVPGDGSNSDYAHLRNDIRNGFQNMSLFERAVTMKEMYQSTPPIMTIMRNDGQRCCCKMPCKWLSTFVCFNCCTDGVEVYSGSLEDQPEKEKGRPWQLDDQKSRLIASATQPVLGGWCWPTLYLSAGQGGSAEPFGKLEGPCCFGGWSEMCFDFNFPVSTFSADRHKGDLGKVVKVKPQSLTNAFTQLMTDADNFSIQFNPDAKLTTEQKVSVLGGQLLADYMYFDGNTEKCNSDENNIYCYFCYSSVFGCICPWKLTIPVRSGN